MKRLFVACALLALASGAQAGEVVKDLRTGRTIGIVKPGESSAAITDPRTGRTLYTTKESGSSIIITDPRTGRTEAIVRKGKD